MKLNKLNIHLFASASIIAGSVVINFIVQIILARFFGLATLGSFALWRNNVQLVAGMSKLGLSNFSLREVPTILKNGKSGQLSPFLIFVTLMALIGIFIFNIIFLMFFEPNNQGYNKTWMFVISCLAMTAIIILSALIRLFDRVIISILFDRLAILSLFLIFLLIGLLTQKPINFELWFLISLLTSLFIISIIFLFSYRDYNRNKTIIPSPPSIDMTVVRRKWVKSLTSFFALDVGNIMSVRTTLLIAGLFLTSDQLGQYVFMLMLAGLVGLPLMGFNMVIAPRISAASANQDFDKAAREINLIRSLSFKFGLIIAIVIFFGYGLLEWIANQPNTVIPLILLIMLIKALINASFGPVGTGLAMLGHQGISAKVLIILVIIKIPILVLACTQFGILGIVIVELLYVFTWNFILALILQNKLKLSRN